MIEKIKSIRKNNTFYYYIGVISMLYLTWKMYKSIIYNNVSVIKDFGSALNYQFGKIYVDFMSFILSIFGFEHVTFIEHARYGDFYAIALKDGLGIFVAYHCLGFAVFFLYNLTILFFEGSFKRKIKYMVVGTFILFLVNVLRLLALTFIRKYASDAFFELNHTVIFVSMVYISLFALHILYLKRGRLI